MSNRQPEENENLLQSIAATVKTILERMATRDEVESLVSKLVTKEEFEPVRAQVAFLGGQVEDIRGRMATKDDIARLETRMDRLEVKAETIQDDVEQVQLRLDGIEKPVSSRIGNVEAEMSRMRSVLYLLVKDRPDMLRLPGQSPPTSG